MQENHYAHIHNCILFSVYPISISLFYEMHMGNCFNREFEISYIFFVVDSLHCVMGSQSPSA